MKYKRIYKKRDCTYHEARKTSVVTMCADCRSLYEERKKFMRQMRKDLEHLKKELQKSEEFDTV